MVEVVKFLTKLVEKKTSLWLVVERMVGRRVEWGEQSGGVEEVKEGEIFFGGWWLLFEDF